MGSFKDTTGKTSISSPKGWEFHPEDMEREYRVSRHFRVPIWHKQRPTPKGDSEAWLNAINDLPPEDRDSELLTSWENIQRCGLDREPFSFYNFASCVTTRNPNLFILAIPTISNYVAVILFCYKQIVYGEQTQSNGCQAPPTSCNRSKRSPRKTGQGAENSCH